MAVFRFVGALFSKSHNLHLAVLGKGQTDFLPLVFFLNTAHAMLLAHRGPMRSAVLISSGWHRRVVLKARAPPQMLASPARVARGCADRRKSGILSSIRPAQLQITHMTRHFLQNDPEGTIDSRILALVLPHPPVWQSLQ